MLWKNCQGVDFQRLVSIYVYCFENFLDLGDRKKGKQKKWKGGKGVEEEKRQEGILV